MYKILLSIISSNFIQNNNEKNRHRFEEWILKHYQNNNKVNLLRSKNNEKLLHDINQS